jgi:hypothetical protein
MVNDLAWKNVKEAYDAIFEALGLDLNAARQQFTKQFEFCKRDFPNNDRGYVIRFKPSFEKQQRGVPKEDRELQEYVCVI